MLPAEDRRRGRTRWAVAATATALAALLLSACAARAADLWIFASFSRTNTGDSTWTDEMALPSRERCLDLMNTAIDADVGVLPLVGVVASRTQNTVEATDPLTHRTLLLTIYSCRPEPALERRGPG